MHWQPRASQIQIIIIYNKSRLDDDFARETVYSTLLWVAIGCVKTFMIDWNQAKVHVGIVIAARKHASCLFDQ